MALRASTTGFLLRTLWSSCFMHAHTSSRRAAQTAVILPSFHTSGSEKRWRAKTSSQRPPGTTRPKTSGRLSSMLKYFWKSSHGLICSSNHSLPLPSARMQRLTPLLSNRRSFAASGPTGARSPPSPGAGGGPPNQSNFRRSLLGLRSNKASNGVRPFLFRSSSARGSLASTSWYDSRLLHRCAGTLPWGSLCRRSAAPACSKLRACSWFPLSRAATSSAQGRWLAAALRPTRTSISWTAEACSSRVRSRSSRRSSLITSGWDVSRDAMSETARRANALASSSAAAFLLTSSREARTLSSTFASRRTRTSSEVTRALTSSTVPRASSALPRLWAAWTGVVPA
mmetsp:Transcript_122062/g.350691  ORF Transcript_122062/g.350691 Transcript_122062/m.350691 type:complete len:342 (+) Transcript_122062:1667-2692(+)